MKSPQAQMLDALEDLHQLVSRSYRIYSADTDGDFLAGIMIGQQRL